MVGVPLVAFTAYLLWVWPRPRGTSIFLEIGPYLLCLLAGLPFAVRVSRGPGRAFVLGAYVAGGFAILWVYALVILCAVRGVCL